MCEKRAISIEKEWKSANPSEIKGAFKRMSEKGIRRSADIEGLINIIL